MTEKTFPVKSIPSIKSKLRPSVEIVPIEKLVSSLLPSTSWSSYAVTIVQEFAWADSASIVIDD